MGYVALWSWVLFNLLSGSGHLIPKALLLFSPVRPVVPTGAAWDCLRGCSQDGLVEAVSGFVDVKVVSLDYIAVFISKARKHLLISLLVIPSWKGLWVAGPVLQVD